MGNSYRLGLDIGSTTIKAVVLDGGGNVVFTSYERHNARVREALSSLLGRVATVAGEAVVHLTGSVAMGVAERCGLPFVQEVVAATNYVRANHADVATMIDIGGEDAKVVFVDKGAVSDLRMNGNCAGGTGAFIDQMAILLGVTTAELDALAAKATRTWPVASRCGVFGKTDIQNLISKNVPREEIAASIFHAVAVQVVVTLAHGCEIKAPVMLCGGPLSFLSGLRKAFADYLKIPSAGMFAPADSHLVPAWGAALADDGAAPVQLSALQARVDASLDGVQIANGCLDPIFAGEADYAEWRSRISAHRLKTKPLAKGKERVTIGIDSGSTTTKVVVLNDNDEMLFSYYRPNEGSPVSAVEEGLRLFQRQCEEAGTEVTVTGSCSTGYGEDLIRAAFRLDEGIVETMAHYTAARHLADDVSFILDIGGQDMKAMFVEGGVVNRIEINEACSSGCGSFIETFAKSLGVTVHDFASMACRAAHPCDLGTRCTVFMNSKVKQALREGATMGDIAAGLSYSVVKNCLYKVLKLKSTSELGKSIVVQGGTMRNDSVVRAFEKIVGVQVARTDHPELMGAVGCAIHARSFASSDSVSDLLGRSSCTVAQRQCHGCENCCAISVYRFAGGGTYYSGNRCERVFNNKGKNYVKGTNVYADKLALLFDRKGCDTPAKGRIGIPRCLNVYEEYPFWHALFTHCGIEVVLSAPSGFAAYEAKANLVMSDNICFPAKLVHSHVNDLEKRGVDRIFMPFVVFERLEGGRNSYNCPIVTGYSQVVKNVQATAVPVDSPAINFKDKRLLRRQCRDYLAGWGVDEKTADAAFDAASDAMADFEARIAARDKEVLAQSRAAGRMTVLLAGRPYHSDELIQHRLSDMVAAMGVDVITDDIVRTESIDLDDTHFVPQWAYANRILKAAKWAAMQGSDVQFMEMTSFGCGPDAFLTDEVRSLLARHGKALTLLKIDDVSNVGSLKLRVRSAIESLRLSASGAAHVELPFVTTPPFMKGDRRRKIIAPFFTPFISPLIPPLMRLAGYDVDNLPMSDAASCEWGLRFANNEVCYPATLIVGDVVKAFKEGRYDPDTTAVAITQTGGQCRASNYIALIKNALAQSGYANVPVVSLTFGSGLGNLQPGFSINWFKIVPIVLTSLLYSDCIAKFYNATVVRERHKGIAATLRDKWLAAAATPIAHNSSDELLRMLASAAAEFDSAALDGERPRVGIVGEIYLKFNPFAQKNVCDWLTDHGIEVVPPLLTDFFLQSFVNLKVKQDSGMLRRLVPDKVIGWIYALVRRRVARVDVIASAFRHYTPFRDIFEESDEAAKVVTLNAQFGEGWVLPGEVMSLSRQGVDHVISLQPFGCIANHIISKGVEKRIRQLCPSMRMLSLDFDSGVSEVNVVNRLLLFIDGLKKKEEAV